MFGLIASFQLLGKMCGNGTKWLKEATSAGNQLVVSVNLVKSALPSSLSSYYVTHFLCLLSQSPVY